MLRRVCGQKRHTDEEYVDWIRRATERARRLATLAGVRDWVYTFGLKSGLGQDMSHDALLGFGVLLRGAMRNGRGSL